jgi:adenine phosphoribosyltransferase
MTNTFISEEEYLELSNEIRNAIRDVPDFPKPGIIFKDITPILSNPDLTNMALDLLSVKIHEHIPSLDAIAGIESRGFLFGMLLANQLNVPFIPIRKSGKLPFHKVSKSYDLEYGTATIEMHSDAVERDMEILIHDDLLATAGTACAAAELIKGQGAKIAGFAFLIELGFLNGLEKIKQHSENSISLIKY